ncbi:selenoprotein S-like isoform X2 [Cyprinus carpio]|uniref:Selenoprotein S-like isoform X2 n=1 Tax=Cyprinus carpio TaxID=7962 RepID=A0A9Q9Y881_CYPCA|nr:selenoprotein S-like isoform X2 [Cyprinus carpio]
MEAEAGARVRNEAVLQNQDLSFLLPSVTAFLSDYGWYVVFMCVGVYLLIQHLHKNRSTDSQSSSVSAASQDPESVVRSQAALEASRRRMQEEQDARAAEFRERQQRLEEEKRRQKIEMWESMKEGKSYRGNAKVAQNTEEATSSSSLRPKTDKKPLRNSGYSPLSGDGGGTCSWRPGRRGPSAGG